MKKNVFIIFISIIVLTVLFAYYKGNPLFSSSNLDMHYSDGDIENCIKTIETYYKGINTGEFKASYDCLYKQKFVDYEAQEQVWLQSYNKIIVNSIEEYTDQNKNSKDEHIFKVMLDIDYKDNPSKYLTDDPTDGSRKRYITLKKDKTKIWKIYKFSAIP